MKKRDKFFFISLFCVIIGVAFVFQAKTSPDSAFTRSNLLPGGSEGNPKNGEPQAQEQKGQEFANRLREKLQLSQDIIEEHTYDLPDMIKNKKVRVLTTLTFSNYFVYEGKAYGYEYSLMEEYKKFLNKGKKRADQVDFYYFPVPWDLLVPGLNKGYGDIAAANLTILQERGEEVDFTDPYQWDLKEVVISREGIEGLQKIEDLSGREVHVREGSSFHYGLMKLNDRLKEKKLAPVEIVALPGLINTGEIIELVNADVLDITVADSHIASIADELLPNIKVYEEIVLNDDVKFGWMVRKNNPQLKTSLNQFIKTIRKGTYLGNVYFKRYFKENPWVREYLKREDFEKFFKYAPLFKKYGEMYGVDWMLVEAQAFQESGLNPGVRSPAGAVGLMQLLPSTAEWMGFKEYSSPENNVHAGVKYLKYLMDQYYPEDEYSATERLRFALATYNAGPGNMQKSVKKSEELGYDPTKWFDNVEMGTMRQVGLEPVHYVRNINKYYLSFLISDILLDIKEEIKQKRLNDLKKKD